MAATFVADCERCNTKRTTFAVVGASAVPGSTDTFFTFGVCRSCFGPSIFELFDRSGRRSPSSADMAGKSLNHLYSIKLSEPVFSDEAQCPEFIPDDIAQIFSEASRCFSVGAFDASGAMSRKVLDAATRSLIGIEPQSVDKTDPNYISWKEAKDLRLRLDWLFSKGKLSPELKELASCVHQDGNDAAHSSETIGREGALDLQDFTVSILETLYTTPGRIAANIARREGRRGKTGA